MILLSLVAIRFKSSSTGSSFGSCGTSNPSFAALWKKCIQQSRKNSKSLLYGYRSGLLFSRLVFRKCCNERCNVGQPFWKLRCKRSNQIILQRRPRNWKNLFLPRQRQKRNRFDNRKDNILYPIEIKKSARPTIDMAKHFSVLSKIAGVSVGQGCIICQCDNPLYLSNEVISLPVEYVWGEWKTHPIYCVILLEINLFWFEEYIIFLILLIPRDKWAPLL